MASATLRQCSDNRRGCLNSETKLGRRQFSPRIQQHARRTRSRAIAIQSPRDSNSKSQEQLLEESRQSEAAAEYDWATWRMYNRIILYRQKHPVKYQHDTEEEENESVDSGDVNGVRSTCNENLRPAASILNTSKSSKDLHEDYGEVFELDL